MYFKLGGYKNGNTFMKLKRRMLADVKDIIYTDDRALDIDIVPPAPSRW